MRRGTAPSALLIALVIGLSPVVSAPHAASSSPLPYQLGVLLSGYYEPIQLNAPATPTTVYFAVSSNATLSTALMTNSQATSFGYGTTDLADSLYDVNSSSATHSMSVSEGIYWLVFFAYGYSANVSFALSTVPTSPYVYYPLTAPEPSGVASFGLYNDSGVVTSYTVESSDVLGVADIASLQAYNASAAEFNDTLSGATLQLNAILVINEKGGQQQDYWTQNTPDFVTATNQVSWADNIWNASVSGVLSNGTVSSTDGGYVYSFSNFGSTGYYYSYQSSNTTYRLPLELALVMGESIVQGVGVRVQMGIQEITNGTTPAKPIDWFDNATINDPTVQSAYFYVAGNATVPNGEFYDTEFVFGGEGNGEATTFTQLSASMGLFYGNSVTGPQSAYPSYYSFGGNTGETTYNLHVSYASNGFSTVSVGTPNYAYLGQASGTCALPPGTCQIPSLVVVTTTTSTSSSASSPSNGLTAYLPYFAAGVLLIAVVAVVLVLFTRRKAPSGEAMSQPIFPPPQPPSASAYCAYCGSAIMPSARFCPNCGAPVHNEEPGSGGAGPVQQ